MILLSTAYLAPIAYYAHLYAASAATDDVCEHYVKQTYRNRCYIATPAGPQALTIPVVRDGAARTATRDIRISDHGNWRHLHWNALVSAYEGSPYFEYYADDFRPLYEKRFEFLVDFNDALRQTVLDELSIQKPVCQTDTYVSCPSPDMTDLRNAFTPKAAAPAAFIPVPYYQVFAQRTGFLPNLSIVDLLFNMGPESRIVLRQCLAPRS